MIDCKYCGRHIPYDANVCPYCGRSIKEQKDVASSDGNLDEQDASTSTQYVEPMPNKKENTNKLLYVIIVILLLLLMCFVGYFLLHQPSGSATDEVIPTDTTMVEDPKEENIQQPVKPVKTGTPSTSSARKEIVVNGEGVRMRFGPSLKAGYLKTPQGGTLSVNKGTRLPCVGEEGDWYKVLYNGKQYYMSKQFCYPAK